jgi:hypothetical protein
MTMHKIPILTLFILLIISLQFIIINSQAHANNLSTKAKIKKPTAEKLYIPSHYN